jgi:hypothetical protein
MKRAVCLKASLAGVTTHSVPHTGTTCLQQIKQYTTDESGCKASIDKADHVLILLDAASQRSKYYGSDGDMRARKSLRSVHIWR